MKKPSCSSGTSQPRQWRHWSVSSRAKPPSLSPKSHMFAARTPQPLWVLQADYHRRTSGELHSPPEEFEHQFVRFIIPFPRGNGTLKGHFENLWNMATRQFVSASPLFSAPILLKTKNATPSLVAGILCEHHFLLVLRLLFFCFPWLIKYPRVGSREHVWIDDHLLLC